ncbi:MAG: hypothetical protein ACXU8N_19390 [Telluria sp.]
MDTDTAELDKPEPPNDLKTLAWRVKKLEDNQEKIFAVLEELKLEMRTLRGELRAGLAELRTEFHVTMNRKLWQMVGVAAVCTSILGLLITLTRH